eukprot:SAG11_NODE_485_length_9035_cov_16.221352_12_plen_66_part_00
MKHEEITYTTTHLVSSSSRARRTDGADHFYQISVYYYIEDLNTAAEDRLRQPRILDLYPDFEYKR